MIGLTFPFEDAKVFVVWVLGCVVIFRLDLFLLRFAGYRVRGVRRLLMWCVIVVAAIVPLQAASLVLLGVVVLSVALGVLLIIQIVTPWGRRTFLAKRMRRRITELLQAEHQPEGTRLPKSVTAWADGLRGYGFEAVPGCDRLCGLPSAVFVRPADGTVAIAARVPVRYDLPTLPLAMLVSRMQGGSGVLVTSLLPGPDLCASAVVQVVRFALPRDLLSLHDEGRALLEDHGFRFTPTQPQEAAAFASAIWTEMLTVHLELTNRELAERWKVVRLAPVTLRSTIHEPAVLAQIRSMHLGDERTSEAPAVDRPGPRIWQTMVQARRGAGSGLLRTFAVEAVRADLHRLSEVEFEITPSDDLPGAVRQAAMEFQALGARLVLAGTGTDGAHQALLVHGGAMVRVAGGRNHRRRRPEVEIASFVEHELGCLTTANVGRILRYWSEEVRQVIPNGRAEDLLAAHEGGTRYLCERGVRFVSIDDHNALRHLSWAVKAESRALLRLPDDRLLRHSQDLETRVRLLPEFADDPGVAELIESVRATLGSTAKRGPGVAP